MILVDEFDSKTSLGLNNTLYNSTINLNIVTTHKDHNYIRLTMTQIRALNSHLVKLIKEHESKNNSGTPS